jgi:hypothetical protein
MKNGIRIGLLALALCALPSLASAAPAPSAPSLSAMPSIGPSPAPLATNEGPLSLMTLAMAVGATSAAAKGGKPTQQQIDEAKARGITVVSRTGEGDPDGEDYTVALATGKSVASPFLAEKARAANAPQPQAGKSLGELAMMSEKELQEEADSRGIKVASSGTVDDGAGNQVPAPVNRQNLIKALTSGPNSGKLDETVPGGKYVNTAGQLVNAHGQRINDDGTMVDPNEQPKTSAQPSY